MRFIEPKVENLTKRLNGKLESEFCELSKLISVLCNAPIVRISSCTEDGFQIKAQYGKALTKHSLDSSLLQLILESPREVVFIKNIREDYRFQDHQILLENPGLTSYSGYALLADDGFSLGVISIFSNTPTQLKTAQKEALKIASDQAVKLFTAKMNLKIAEKANIKRTLALENIVDCTGAGTWYLDLESNELIFNEKWAQQIGYTLKELKPINFETWQSLVHPEDFKQACDKLESFSKSKSADYEVEFRMLHKKGNWVWIRSKGKVLKYTRDGFPLILFGTHLDIDEKKKIEIQLLREKERFEYAAKATSDILWDWDVLNNSIFFGDSYKKFFGFEPSTNDTDHSREWHQRLHPEERETVIASLKEALESDYDKWQHEYRFRRQDESYAHVVDKAFIVRDEKGLPVRVVGAFQDVTSRKESELQLKVFESIINKTKDSIIITKADPIDGPSGPEIIYVNDAVVNRTGYTKEELIGQTPRIFQGENTDPATIKHISNKLRKWEVIDVDIINYSKTGKEYWINLSIVPVTDDTGKFKYWISVQKDITDRKIFERSLTDLNNELHKKTAELELSNSELEQFAYVTSHDLQEPLRMVTSFLTQLERKYSDVLDEKGKTYIHFAVDGAKRMRQLILDLLEYSRVGKMNEPLEEVDLNALMNDVVELSDRFIKEKNATVLVEKLPVVNSFYTPLRQVFLNLINNGLKYSSEERTPEIIISSKETPHSFQIIVRDNGIGIKKEYLEKIFIIFQRLHTREEYSGTGIGLAITKKLMEHLGGKIYVESDLEKGSSFIIEILKK